VAYKNSGYSLGLSWSSFRQNPGDNEIRMSLLEFAMWLFEFAVSNSIGEILQMLVAMPKQVVIAS
jgi:hypothetical protein